MAGDYAETDYQGDPDQKALQRMRQSGWWGDLNSVHSSEELTPVQLSAVLQKKSGRSHSDLSSPGVYMYLKKADNQIYIGSAVHETLLERQMRHLNNAAYTDTNQPDKFDEQLSHQYGQENWHFYAIPMSASNPEEICEKEKELIIQYNSEKHGYNT